MKAVPSVGFHKMDTKSRGDDISTGFQPRMCLGTTWRLVKSTDYRVTPAPSINSLGLSYCPRVCIYDKFPSHVDPAGLGTTFEPIGDARYLPKL